VVPGAPVRIVRKYSEITFVTTFPPNFCRISEIMVPLNSANFTASDGLEKIFFGTQKLWESADPALGSLICGRDDPNRHIYMYDLSASNP